MNAPSSTETQVRIAVYLRGWQIEAVARAAAKHGISSAEVIRRSLDEEDFGLDTAPVYPSKGEKREFRVSTAHAARLRAKVTSRYGFSPVFRAAIFKSQAEAGSILIPTQNRYLHVIFRCGEKAAIKAYAAENGLPMTSPVLSAMRGECLNLTPLEVGDMNRWSHIGVRVQQSEIDAWNAEARKQGKSVTVHRRSRLIADPL